MTTGAKWALGLTLLAAAGTAGYFFIYKPYKKKKDAKNAGTKTPAAKK
jgi:hypothetical protein